MPRDEGLARAWLRLLIVVAGVGILGSTLFPFAPELPGPSIKDWKAEVVRRVEWQVPSRGGLRDMLGNVVLFVPLGFGVAGVASGWGFRRGTVMATAMVVCTLLSFGIETFQFLIPSRDPAIADVLSNGAGGVAGAGLFQVAGRALLDGCTWLLAGRGANRLSAARLVIAHLSYAAIILGGSALAAQNAPFEGWDAGARVVVGSGGARDLVIADRAMSPDQLEKAVAAIRSGASPGEQGSIVFYAPGPTPEVACDNADVSRRIAASSQFALAVTLAAGQPSWAVKPHVALHSEGGVPNLQVYQQNAHLLICLSTPQTGSGGLQPQFFWPHLFADGAAHAVCLSFDGRRLNAYSDGRLESSVDMSPETRFIWRLLPFRPALILLGRSDTRLWRLAYDFAAFVPLGIMAGLIATTGLAPLMRAGLATAASLLPPVAIQFGVSRLDYGSGAIDWQSAVSGMAAAAAASAVSIALAPWWSRRVPLGAGAASAREAAVV